MLEWAHSLEATKLALAVGQKAHILTVSVEDYFHVGALASHVRPKHWDRLQPRLEHNIEATLELLASGDVKATFFVLGCIAEQQPHIVAQIVDAGHEVLRVGHRVRDAGQIVVRAGHRVAAGGHMVDDGGQRVAAAGH